MCAADGFCTRLRKAKAQHLALRDEVLDRARDVLDRHGRVDPVLIIQIDVISPQTLQGGFNDALDALRSTIKSDGAVDREAKFRGDLDLVADRLERLANKFFVD